jgi:tetratricopeptide (TPR) repeat protein
LCPDAWVFRSHLGRALLDCHDFEAAVGEYRKCLEQCAGDPEVGYELGLALIGVGRIAEALAEFQRCVQASPDDFKVHDRIGACLIALKRPWDAVPPLRRATALNPAHADSWMGLSCAFGLAGQRENALAALVQAVSLEPASFSKCWGTFLALTDRFFRIGRARDLAGAGLVLAMALGIGRFRCLANLLLRPLRALAPDAPFEADAAGPTCDTVDNGGLPESAKRGDSAGTSALD